MSKQIKYQEFQLARQVTTLMAITLLAQLQMAFLLLLVEKIISLELLMLTLLPEMPVMEFL